jgi:hypothetical protein
LHSSFTGTYGVARKKRVTASFVRENEREELGEKITLVNGEADINRSLGKNFQADQSDKFVDDSIR